MRKSGKVNYSRLFKAIGRIGYDPVSAILDIVDNSVSADATRIGVCLHLTAQDKSKNLRKATISAFEILDNGCGMDENGLDNAICLGSDQRLYSEGTLSKFGLGLKSASASLGKELTLVSRRKGSDTFTLHLNQDELADSFEYDLNRSSQDEVTTLNNFVRDTDSGTIVRISAIHSEQMPRASEIVERLKQKASIVYFPFLPPAPDTNTRLELTIDGAPIYAIDPLFCNEIAEPGGDLDERSWDGCSVRWIYRPKPIQLDEGGSISAQISITQLPHPPSAADANIMTQKQCRDKFNIGAGNYGIYIYRNNRLISWADPLGMIQQDQDLYSFRAHLEITAESDDILNLDVTKSRIILSEIAEQQLRPLIDDAKKKSIVAWQRRTQALRERTTATPHAEVNETIDRVEKLEQENDKIDFDISAESEKKELQDRTDKAFKATPATEEEKQRATKEGERVQYVDSLDNNVLWERALDPSIGLIVRVNAAHRFVRELVNVSDPNPELVKAVDILLYSLARGELHIIRRNQFRPEDVDRILQDYREQVGIMLSNVVREIDVSSGY